MRKLALALALASWTLCVQAQTITQQRTTTLSFSLGSFDTVTKEFDFSFDGVDSTLYEITSVTLDLNVDQSMTGTGFSFKNTSLSGAATVGVTNRLYAPSRATNTSTTGTLLGTFTAPAFGTQTYSNGVDHYTGPTLTLPSSEYAAFYGAVGTVGIHLQGSATSTLTIFSSMYAVSAIGASSVVTDKATATLRVTTSPVPEPASFLAILTGIGSLAAKRRRR